MSKHTPGPWVYGGFVDYMISTADGSVDICSVLSGSATEKEDLANAALIAASPELLESAEAFLVWFKEFVGKDAYAECMGEVNGCTGSQELQRMVRAINKAKG